jgi:hypothetical protein
MSWRRFCVLLSNLSADSALAHYCEYRASGAEPIADPIEAERAVKAVWR